MSTFFLEEWNESTLDAGVTYELILFLQTVSEVWLYKGGDLYNTL